MPIASSRIALQLWTLRHHLQSTGDIARSFARVRELGFEQVELGGLPALEPGELRRLAEAAGLRILASHEDPAELLAEPAKVADRLAALGCRLAVFARPHQPLTTIDDVLALADALSRAGEQLRSRGRLLTYLNRAHDFRKVGGKAILDLLYEHADPFLVHAELDTYFVQLGGGDPAAYCARLSGRLPLLHVKDFGVGEDERPVAAPLGDGNLNFPVILREAEAAACENYVIEQDVAPGDDAFAAIAKSLRHLTSL